MSVGLLLLAPLANGADRRIQVEASETRGVLTAISLKNPRKSEIRLKDGAMLSETLTIADVSGIQFRVKKGAAAGDRVIAYDQLSTIRVDLGPHRGWQAAGAALGAAGGIGAGLAFDSHGLWVAVPFTVIGGTLLGLKLGERHRKWLMIEVR